MNRNDKGFLFYCVFQSHQNIKILKEKLLILIHPNGFLFSFKNSENFFKKNLEWMQFSLDGRIFFLNYFYFLPNLNKIRLGIYD